MSEHDESEMLKVLLDDLQRGCQVVMCVVNDPSVNKSRLVIAPDFISGPHALGQTVAWMLYTICSLQNASVSAALALLIRGMVDELKKNGIDAEFMMERSSNRQH